MGAQLRSVPDGKTQRELAAEIGKDKAHVHRMNQVWIRFGADLGQQDGSRSFNSYYQEVKRGPGAKESEPDDVPPDTPRPNGDVTDGGASWDKASKEINRK